MKRKMRAVIYRKYGPPTEVMELENNIFIPKPLTGETLIKVEGSSVNAADMHMVRANYLIIRLILGLFKPSKRRRILGMDIAGTVESIGENVTGFKIGDSVAADLRNTFGGGFAEYAIVKADRLVKIPNNVSFQEAATVPISGQAAMMGITLCNIKPGDSILINGASGGVGSYGIQIAKSLGAHVTAICSSTKSSEVISWGADETIDYKVTSLNELRINTYDAVFDTACFEKPSVFAQSLKDKGRYVLVGGSYYNMLKVKLFGKCYAQRSQNFRSLTQEVEVNDNIKKVFEMISQGKIKPAIQKIVPLGEVPKAINSLIQRTVTGKIVVNNQI